MTTKEIRIVMVKKNKKKLCDVTRGTLTHLPRQHPQPGALPFPLSNICKPVGIYLSVRISQSELRPRWFDFQLPLNASALAQPLRGSLLPRCGGATFVFFFLFFSSFFLTRGFQARSSARGRDTSGVILRPRHGSRERRVVVVV